MKYEVQIHFDDGRTQKIGYPNIDQAYKRAEEIIRSPYYAVEHLDRKPRYTIYYPIYRIKDVIVAHKE